jgi:hypothetical protein
VVLFAFTNGLNALASYETLSISPRDITSSILSRPEIVTTLSNHIVHTARNSITKLARKPPKHEMGAITKLPISYSKLFI